MYWDILNAWNATGYGILVQGLNWIVEQYTFGTEMGNEPKKYIDLSLYLPLPRSSPQKLLEISWFVCLDITSLFVTSTANDSTAQICLHSNIHKWTKPKETIERYQLGTPHNGLNEKVPDKASSNI